MKCNFDRGWAGKCDEDANDSGYCIGHEKVMCVSCGSKATHECEETSQFVCGAPLCSHCEHTIFPDGTNGSFQKCPEGMTRHCKKEEQKYTPWYSKERMEERDNNELQEKIAKMIANNHEEYSELLDVDSYEQECVVDKDVLWDLAGEIIALVKEEK